jgi:DNA primase
MNWIKQIILKWLGLDQDTLQEMFNKAAYDSALEALTTMCSEAPIYKRRQYVDHFFRRFRHKIEDIANDRVRILLHAQIGSEQFIDDMIARINRKQVQTGLNVIITKEEPNNE